MKNKFLIAGVLVLLGIGWWLFYYYSDKEVIKRQFIVIAKELSKENEETPVMIAMKMKPVKEFLAQNCTVAVPERDYLKIMEPGLAIRYVILYRNRHNTLMVTYDDLAVETQNNSQAAVRARVHLSGTNSQTESFEEVHQVEFALRKTEKIWLIKKAILPEALVQ